MRSRKVVYKCGCTASGHNVAERCPIHLTKIEKEFDNTKQWYKFLKASGD